MQRAQLSWEECYKLACDYVEQYGNIVNISRKYVTKGCKLGQWIRDQRIAYKNRTISEEDRKNNILPLTDEQVSKLEAIGMNWNPKLTWDEWYQLALDYVKEYGSITNIKLSYETKDGYRLGNWINSQRAAYRNRKIPKEERLNNYLPLTDDKVKKLENIGMYWSIEKLTWDEWYQLACEYAKENGSIDDIRVNYVTKEGHKLGAWIGNQRQAYKNRNVPKRQRIASRSPLTNDQVSKLEAIGMSWNPKLTWDEWYRLANDYAKRNGSIARLEPNYVTIEGFRLGLWIQRQRVLYKNRTLLNEEGKYELSALTDEQVSKLEKIGMIWNVRKNINHVKRLCKEYGINYLKNGEVLRRIPVRIFETKIAFCKENNIALTINGFLNYLFIMSNREFEFEYGISTEELANKYNETHKLKLDK